MENLIGIADFLRKQLADVETKIQKLKEQKGLTMEEIRQQIADVDKDPKWKSFVTTPYGVVDNIVTILDDCYYSFVEMIEEKHPEKNAVLILGSYMSKKWRQFEISVIKKLLDPKNYDEAYDFEDTASGCDELAWDAASDLIDEIIQN